jgi:hypothetical protein
MIYRYRTNYSNFAEAQRLHMKATPKFAIPFWVCLRILPALGLIAFLVMHFDFVSRKNGLIVVIASGLMGAGAVGLIMALIRPLSLRRLYKQMKNGREDDAELELELQDGQLVSRVPGRSEGRFLPAAIQRFVENDNIALLYVGQKRFLVIPKTALSEEAWLSVRGWLAVAPERF